MKRASVWGLLTGFMLIYSAGCKDKSPSLNPPQAGTPSQVGTPSQAEAAPSIHFTSTLSKEERRELYHLPEGGEMLPLDVVRAVESVRTFKPFLEDVQRFRLIPDPEDPDGLPVGMSAQLREGKRAEPKMVFFNCAACHTAELTYRGKVVRVDGAPGQVDIAGFIVELLQSIDSTVVDPQRLATFVKRLRPLPGSAKDAKEELQAVATATKLLQEKLIYLKRLRSLRPTTTAGFGRLDAFVAARNLLFGDKYAIDVNSPVSLPPMFGLSRLGWFHYDNNTNSILQRNIGEDLGVGAVADLHSGESTVEIRNLIRLESLAAKLQTPRWPEEVFGKPDAARVARGAIHYQKECASCHDSSQEGKFPDRVISLEDLGTDPNRLRNFATPVGSEPFSQALGAALEKVEQKAFAREHITAEEAKSLEPPRVVWRTSKGYAARPIDGAWATAPYLHNGSVPTLLDLLRPPAERPKTFLTGSREFDPHKVGFVHDGAAGGTFLLDTALDGNHNTGHLYGTTLPEAQRLDLLEYLKTR